MDWSSDLTVLNFSDFENRRTNICRRTLNPVWGQDFRFEISDKTILQSEPLELRVLDYDQISSNGSIGITFIDLSPLLSSDSTGVISGWLPMYCITRFMCWKVNPLRKFGEINCTVKLQNFSGINNINTQPSEISFYNSDMLTEIPCPVSVIGFVSATVTDEDPEHHWSDTFRSQRMSNEARVRILYKISGKLRRQFGKRVSMMNGNSVVGVKQSFIFEAEDGRIMGRAIGTVVKILNDPNHYSGNFKQGIHDSVNKGTYTNSSNSYEAECDGNGVDELRSSSSVDANNLKVVDSKNKVTADPDSSHRSSSSSMDSSNGARVVLNLRIFPNGIVSGIGGIVSAISFRNIEDDSARTREIWWDNLREELTTHARFLFCQSVIGYTETCSVCEDMMVLHCMGTAANVDMDAINYGTHLYNRAARQKISDQELNNSETKNQCDMNRIPEYIIGSHENKNTNDTNLEMDMGNNVKNRFRGRDVEKYLRDAFCKILHSPYDHRSAPYPMRLRKCNVCHSGYVPEVIFTTIEIPSEVARSNHMEILEAFTFYDMKGKFTKFNSSTNAFSGVVPFIQYEIHRQLMCKMRLFGFNAIHCLTTQINITSMTIMFITTGTGICLYALPIPPILELKPTEINDDNFTSRNISPNELLEKISKVRTEVANELQNISILADRSSDSSSTSTSLSASAYVRESGTVVINLDDEPCNYSSLLLGFSSNSKLKLLTSSPTGEIANYNHVEYPHIYARPAVVSVIKCISIKSGSTVLKQLSLALNGIFDDLSLHFCHLKTCFLTNVNFKVTNVKDKYMLIVLTGSSLGENYESSEHVDKWIFPNLNLLKSVAHNRKNLHVSYGSNRKLEVRSLSPNPSPGSNSRQGKFSNQTESSQKYTAPQIGLNSHLSSAQMSGSKSQSIRQFESAKNLDVCMYSNQYTSASRKSEVFSQVFGDNPNLHSFGLDIPLGDEVDTSNVIITSTNNIPNMTITRFIGRICFHLVREVAFVYSSNSSDNISKFHQRFMTEVYAIIRTHVSSMGGNAMLCYSIDHIIMNNNLKTHGYAVLSVSGDAVRIT